MYVYKQPMLSYSPLCDQRYLSTISFAHSCDGYEPFSCPLVTAKTLQSLLKGKKNIEVSFGPLSSYVYVWKHHFDILCMYEEGKKGRGEGGEREAEVCGMVFIDSVFF